MGRGQRGNNAAHLLGSSPTFPTSSQLSCESGKFSHRGNPCCSPQSALSVSFLFSQPYRSGPPPCHGTSQPAPPAQSITLPRVFFPCLAARLPCSFLLVWLNVSFNSFIVGVPCSLIFWHFLLFTEFRLVIFFLLVVGGSEGFLPMPPSWPGTFSVFLIVLLLFFNL